MRKVYSVIVLKRFMTDKQIQDFNQEYSDNLLTRGRSRIVNSQDLRILDDYSKGKMLEGELSKKWKMSRGRINTALRLAALSKLK